MTTIGEITQKREIDVKEYNENYFWWSFVFDGDEEKWKSMTGYLHRFGISKNDFSNPRVFLDNQTAKLAQARGYSPEYLREMLKKYGLILVREGDACDETIQQTDATNIVARPLDEKVQTILGFDTPNPTMEEIEKVCTSHPDKNEYYTWLMARYIMPMCRQYNCGAFVSHTGQVYFLVYNSK